MTANETRHLGSFGDEATGILHQTPQKIKAKRPHPFGISKEKGPTGIAEQLEILFNPPIPLYAILQSYEYGLLLETIADAARHAHRRRLARPR